MIDYQEMYDEAVLDLAKILYRVDYVVEWDEAPQAIRQRYLNTARRCF